MPRLSLVYPCIGRFPGGSYVRSWQMQPLAMAVLAGLTPREWRVTFFDDRLEEIDYGAPCDLAAISLETFTARRGYQIAAEFRARGVPVVLGGYHATFRPDEALAHADAVCVGEAEGVWETILADAAGGRLRGRYDAVPGRPLGGLRPDRRIFAGKNYFPIALVETGRGCPHRCGFCSVTAFHRGSCRRRPVADILHELAGLRERRVFFVDDNIAGDQEGAAELFRGLAGSGVRWVSQASLDVCRDETLVRLMARSGCVGLLVGFESLHGPNLAGVGKHVNRVDEYRKTIARMRDAGLAIYGTFMFGFPDDSPDSFDETVRFAVEHRMYLAAFNHIVPFPGTPLYRELDGQGRLASGAWWLDDGYRMGDVPFHPVGMDRTEVRERCLRARRRFFSVPSMAARVCDMRANCRTLAMAGAFLHLNLLMRSEVTRKRRIPLGVRPRTG